MIEDCSRLTISILSCGKALSSSPPSALKALSLVEEELRRGALCLGKLFWVLQKASRKKRDFYISY